MKLFIIEDEVPIRKELTHLIEKYGFQCESSDDFHDIAQLALASGADLILLDTTCLTRTDSRCAGKSGRVPMSLSLCLPAGTQTLTN